MGTYAALVAPSSGERAQPAAAAQAQALVAPQSQASSGGQSSLISGQVRTVNPGDRVNIPCLLANMGGSIQFAKDDQPIILDSGCAHCQLDISNDGQASLTINRVSRKDQGHWQCWRLDAQGKVKQKIPIIQLVITNSPELPILIVNDKELLGGNSLDATITVKENELVNFKCVIKGAKTPVDYVHWMLDSTQNVTQMSQLMIEFSAEDSSFRTESLLKLNATKAMNLKSISCLSNHRLWLTPMTVTAFLNVLYEPSFTISREPGFGIPVSEGMLVVLKCEIDSNPSSSPVWIKDADNKTANAVNNALGQGQTVTGREASGEPIVLDTQDDGSVVFQRAQRSDSGWYRCKTENKYGNFSSFGYYLNVHPAAQSGAPKQVQSIPPQNQIQSSLPSATPSSQQPAQLQQESAGRFTSPAAITRDNFYPGQQPLTSKVMAPNQAASQALGGGLPRPPAAQQLSSNIMNNDQPVTSAAFAGGPMTPFNPALAPHPMSASEVARCKSGRPDGFPEIDHPVSTVNAVLGRQLTLPLRFCCNPGPARVFWIHRHLAMVPGRMFGPYITRNIYTTYNSFYCYESTFEIESVKLEDIGTVYVFVTNEKGHAGAEIHIQLAADQGSLGARYPLSGSSSAASSRTMQVPGSSMLTMNVILSLLLPLLTYFHLIKKSHHLHHLTGPIARTVNR